MEVYRVTAEKLKRALETSDELTHLFFTIFYAHFHDVTRTFSANLKKQFGPMRPLIELHSDCVCAWLVGHHYSDFSDG